MPSPFPYCPVIREWSWKKHQIEKKGPCHIETESLISRANQWTWLYMMETSVILVNFKYGKDTAVVLRFWTCLKLLDWICFQSIFTYIVRGKTRNFQHTCSNITPWKHLLWKDAGEIKTFVILMACMVFFSDNSF